MAAAGGGGGGGVPPSHVMFIRTIWPEIKSNG